MTEQMTGTQAQAASKDTTINGIQLESELEGDIDLNGFLGLDADVPRGFTGIRITFRVKADVDNMERLKQLTGFSPVFNTITRGVPVDIQVEAKQG